MSKGCTIHSQVIWLGRGCQVIVRRVKAEHELASGMAACHTAALSSGKLQRAAAWQL